jgi:hypothetical protein
VIGAVPVADASWREPEGEQIAPWSPAIVCGLAAVGHVQVP